MHDDAGDDGVAQNDMAQDGNVAKPKSGLQDLVVQNPIKPGQAKF